MSAEKEVPVGTHVETKTEDHAISAAPPHDGTIHNAAGKGQVATDK